MWNAFHSDPRTSYYLFLRRGYRCSAVEAFRAVKRADAMVISLQHFAVKPRALTCLRQLVRKLLHAVAIKADLLSRLPYRGLTRWP